MTMPDDFRLAVGVTTHPKTQKLIRRVGYEGFYALVRLIEFCTVSKTDGVLSGMTGEDIELCVGWRGDPDALVDALVETRFLDEPEHLGGDSWYEMHNWEKRQPWVSGSGARSEAARRAASARWEKRASGGQKTNQDAHRMRRACDPHADRNAHRMPSACDPHASRTGSDAQVTKNHAERNAPSQPSQPSQPTNHAEGMRAASRAASSDTLSVGELSDRLVEWGWTLTIPPKWYPMLQRLEPFKLSEVSDCKTETLAAVERSGGRPNVGLFLRVLERRRNEAQRPAPPNHPQPGTEWASGRAREAAEASPGANGGATTGWVQKPVTTQPQDIEPEPTPEQVENAKQAIKSILGKLTDSKSMGEGDGQQ